MATADFATATKERRYEFPLSVAFTIMFASASIAFARGFWLPWIHTNSDTLPVIGAAFALVFGLFGVSAFFSIRLAFEIEGAQVTDRHCILEYRYLGRRIINLPFGGRLKPKVYLPDLRSTKGYREALLVSRGLAKQVVVPLNINGAEKLGSLLSKT